MKRFLITILVLLFASTAQAGFFSGGSASSSSGSVATDAIWDAAGDTVYGTGSDTAGRLAKGTAYQLYMMNSGATAPAWTSTLGATGTRLTKGWFTDLEITNAPTINGNAMLASTGTAYAIPTFTAANTIGEVVNGTTAQVLTATTGAVPSWSSTLSISTLNLTSSTSSIPWPVGTSTWPTTEGAAKWDSTNDALYIGDGATSIKLDLTANSTYTFPSATSTLASLTGTETLTNKTLTTPVITSLEVLIDCNGSEDPYAYCTGANASTLTATHTSRTIINSYGRGEAQTVTLPAAATGMTFIALVGTQHNSAWKIQRAGSDTITWSSGGTDTTGKTYFQETNQAVGSRVSCITYKTGASAWSWLCGSVTGTWVTD